MSTTIQRLSGSISAPSVLSGSINFTILKPNLGNVEGIVTDILEIMTKESLITLIEELTSV